MVTHNKIISGHTATPVWPPGKFSGLSSWSLDPDDTGHTILGIWSHWPSASSASSINSPFCFSLSTTCNTQLPEQKFWRS